MSLPLDSLLLKPRIQRLDCDLFAEHRVRVSVLRLDEMHPHLGGNKWFKLRPNIAALLRDGLPLAVSFGGAWSNHLRALAAAGKELGFATLGFVRGEQYEPLNPVLEFAADCGMELRYLSRTDYRRKDDPDFLRALTANLGPHLIIPEGGSNAAAVEGCMEIASLLRWQQPLAAARRLMLACGTGTTMAGLIRGLSCSVDLESGFESPLQVTGVSVLKAPGYIQGQVQSHLQQEAAVNWNVLDDYHCGGYARSDARLEAFLSDFASFSGIPLEPVYTGKLMLALWDQISRGGIPADSEVMVLHSGGVFVKNGKNSHKSV